MRKITDGFQLPNPDLTAGEFFRELIPEGLSRFVMKALGGLFVFAVYGYLIWGLSLMFLMNSDVNLNHRATVPMMMDGSAHRPFVFRRLLPGMALLGEKLTPDALEDRFEAQWERSHTMAAFRKYFRVDPEYMYENVLVFTFMVLFLLLYALSMRKLGMEMLGAKGFSQHLVPVLGLLALPPFFNFGYIYDFPVLGLSAACYLFLYRKKWDWYFVTFALACYNKETALLFGIVYGFTMMNQLPIKRFFLLGGLQALVFAVIRGGLMLRYQDNPGENMRDHLEWQLRSLLEPYSFSAAILLFLLAGLVGYGWRAKPVFLRNALWVLLPLTLLFLVGGAPGELRVFYEAVPLLVLLLCSTLLTLVASRRTLMPSEAT